MAYLVAGVELGQNEPPPMDGGSGSSGVTAADVKNWGNAAASVGLSVSQFLQQMGMGGQRPAPAPEPSPLGTYGVPLLIAGSLAVVAVLALKKK